MPFIHSVCLLLCVILGVLGHRKQPIVSHFDNRIAVRLPQGRVVGRSISVRNTDPETQAVSVLPLDLFLGIPFAQAPLGKLRFQKPLPVPDTPSRIIDADRYGLACMQPLRAKRRERSSMSEDCLSINVIRPSGMGKAGSLPVMVWIYGGALTSGESSSVDDTSLVAQSIRMGRPIIYVSFNYRLNVFGFLASEEVEASEDATLNAGFHDQRFALQWIQRNIHKFGGDPTKVTAFGESAGGASVAAQMLWRDRNKSPHDPSSIQQPPFSGAILQSGFMLGMPIHKPSFVQDGFNSFAALVGCTNRREVRHDANQQVPIKMSNGTAAVDVLSCLRSVPPDGLLSAMMSSLSFDLLDLWRSFAAVIDDNNAGSDGVFFPSRMSLLLKSGRFTQIPTILGTVLDEGTIFAPHDCRNEEDLRLHVKKSWIHYQGQSNNDDLVDKLFAMYPDDPRLGSPYHSQSDRSQCIDSLSHNSRDGCDRIYPPLSSNQYKRTASILGDAVFDSSRRALSLDMVQRQKDAPVWNYQFRQPAKWGGGPSGIFHSSEIPYVFGAFAEEQSDHGVVSKMMSTAWIHFAHDLNPNGPGDGTNGPHWPKYTASGREMLEIRSGAIRVVKDDYREDAMEWMGNDAEWNFATGR